MPTERIKRELRTIRGADAGRRFEDAHERQRIDNHVVRVLVIIGGAVVVLAGAATFWLPGPQVLIVLVGLALMASQWRVVARLLDWIEVRARRVHEERWAPYRHKRRAKLLAMVAFVAVLALLVWALHGLGWIPGWVPVLGD